MNVDSLTICDRCGSDATYCQEVSKDVKVYQCYGCGFYSNTALKPGSEYLEEQLELLPNLYKELMGEDEHGKVWMPSTINIPNQGMVFANGTNSTNWKWGAVKAIKVTKEEKEKYPIPGKKGEYYKYRMDMENMVEFNEGDFMEALDFIGVFSKESLGS